MTLDLHQVLWPYGYWITFGETGSPVFLEIIPLLQNAGGIMNSCKFPN